MDSKRESKQGEAEHVVDVNKLTYYSADTFVSGKFSMSPKCCIFKIPVILKRHSKKAYTPNAFSIGPWHLGDPGLQPTQKIKQKYLLGLINRLSRSDPVTKFDQLEKVIKEVEAEAREYYAGPVEAQHLYKILLLDGCFIVELFRKDARVVARDEDDPVFNMSCMLQFLYHDLVLLENQIPWFVLEKLFEMTRINPETESKSLDELALNFFGNIFTYDRPSFEVLNETGFRYHKSKHILDLLRNSLTLPFEKSQEQKQESGGGTTTGHQWKSNQISHRIFRESSSKRIRRSEEDKEGEISGWQPLGNATSLSEAGIKFKKVVSNTILDVKFRNGAFEMPSLLVQETTETIFRNLISLEQCTPNYPPAITSYARIMDNLIDTVKDTEILCKEKIIDNWLEAEESTGFFNKLYNDAYMKEFHYHDLCHRVNTYLNTYWPKHRANLMHNYFSNPWSGIGVTVGGLVFVMTIIGTVCSIIQAKHT